jgi:cytochrome c oxidase assembly protein subunit 15
MTLVMGITVRGPPPSVAGGAGDVMCSVTLRPATDVVPPLGRRPLPHRSYRLAVGFTLGAVVLGSAVCATESGAACPTWPGCFQGAVTPNGLQSGIEFTHRVVAFLSLVFLGLAAWEGRRLSDRRLRWFPRAALVMAIASGVFGMMIILFRLPLVLGLIDVGAALTALSLITYAAVRLDSPGPGTRLSGAAWATQVIVILMHLLGIVVAGKGSFVRCLGWPVWRIVGSDLSPGLQGVRIALGVVAAALLAGVLVAALRRPALRLQAALLGATWLAELVMGQAIIGQFTGAQQRSIGFAAVYSMLAGLIVWQIALLASRAGKPATAQ